MGLTRPGEALIFCRESRRICSRTGRPRCGTTSATLRVPRWKRLSLDSRLGPSSEQLRLGTTSSNPYGATQVQNLARAPRRQGTRFESPNGPLPPGNLHSNYRFAEPDSSPTVTMRCLGVHGPQPVWLESRYFAFWPSESDGVEPINSGRSAERLRGRSGPAQRS